MKNDLKVYQRVTIQLFAPCTIGHYTSRVDGIEPDSIILYTPLRLTGVVPVAVGEKATVVYSNILAQYSFDAQVLESDITAQVPLIRISKPEVVKKIQRRRYVRIRMSVPVIFNLVNKDDGEKQYCADTLDISGSGIKLNSPVPLSSSEIIKIRLDLPSREPVYAYGRVIRSDIDKTKGFYITCIDFIDISETERDKIIAYVFDKQVEMRKKGLIRTIY
jgi:c-di-GMP-binding flagellar brake protein YcgR